jgi:hypothetical protein
VVVLVFVLYWLLRLRAYGIGWESRHDNNWNTFETLHNSSKQKSSNIEAIQVSKTKIEEEQWYVMDLRHFLELTVLQLVHGTYLHGFRAFAAATLGLCSRIASLCCRRFSFLILRSFDILSKRSLTDGSTDTGVTVADCCSTPSRLHSPKWIPRSNFISQV